MGKHLKKIIDANDAPKAIGPYSPVIQGGPFLFISGQLGIDPEKGTLAEGIAGQTKQALLNLTALLKAANTDCSNVVKTTVFLTEINDFTAMNEVYAQFFPSFPPARSAVQVAALPRAALVEIEAVALANSGCCD